MKLSKPLFCLSLFICSLSSNAQTLDITEKTQGSTFHFSTQVQRSVEKDLIRAELYSRKSGKSLTEIKKQVSRNINKLVTQLKSQSAITFSVEGLRNYADYDSKGKIIGWVAESHIQLESQNIEAMSQIFDNLGDDIAIRYIDFSVSPEKITALEDEMMQVLIKQFQQKASLIAKTLNRPSYKLHNVHLTLPSTQVLPVNGQSRMFSAASHSEFRENIPLESNKATISASASGEIIID